VLFHGSDYSVSRSLPLPSPPPATPFFSLDFQTGIIPDWLAAFTSPPLPGRPGRTFTIIIHPTVHPDSTYAFQLGHWHPVHWEIMEIMNLRHFSETCKPPYSSLIRSILLKAEFYKIPSVPPAFTLQIGTLSNGVAATVVSAFK
jgi:hypothetical protein